MVKDEKIWYKDFISFAKSPLYIFPFKFINTTNGIFNSVIRALSIISVACLIISIRMFIAAILITLVFMILSVVLTESGYQIEEYTVFDKYSNIPSALSKEKQKEKIYIEPEKTIYNQQMSTVDSIINDIKGTYSSHINPNREYDNNYRQMSRQQLKTRLLKNNVTPLGTAFGNRNSQKHIRSIKDIYNTPYI